MLCGRYHNIQNQHIKLIQTTVGRCYRLTGVWSFYIRVVVTFFTAAAELTQTEPSAWNGYALRDKKEAIFKKTSLLVISPTIGSKIFLHCFFYLYKNIKILLPVSY